MYWEKGVHLGKIVRKDDEDKGNEITNVEGEKWEQAGIGNTDA